MTVGKHLRSCAAAFAMIALAACTSGSDISSPGSGSGGTPPGGGGPGGPGGPGTATCPSGFASMTAVGGLTVCRLSGTILNNLTLPYVAGVAYRLDGRVDIGADIGGDGTKAGGSRATLTVEPGVTIFGASGSDYLVINRGSQIVADGTAAAPIVFTSDEDLTRRAANANDLGGDNIGEWGGIVILGRAPVKNCNVAGVTGGSAACENAVEGVSNPDALYGGALATDRSGKLEYVQVRFAGFPLASGNELNGITFGGVGSETEVDYIQVHNNADDGVEFFGGTVNVRHLVLTGNDDDSIDTDTGWQGGIQFAVVTQRAAGGDNIVEASSAGVSTTPTSNARVANFTFVGNRTNAFRLNTGTIGRYVNGVVNYGKQCFRWEANAGDGAAGFTAGADPQFNSVLFQCVGGLATSNSQTGAAEASVGADANNVIGTSSLAANVFPGPNELAVTPFNVTTLGSFFQATTYIGAFSGTESVTSNWAAGWTFALFPEPTCPTGTVDSGSDLNGQNVCNLSGTVTADIRLTRGNLYRLAGRVNIGVDVGGDAAGSKAGGDVASITIEPGVTVFGASGADYMVVARGSQIFSNGTPNAPVVFTSLNDLSNSQADAANAIGEWGGLVILGRAPVKNCNVSGVVGGAANCEAVVEGVSNPDALYGGEVAADDSGAINYTQVKYAGFPLAAGNELNGVTFGGVGSATEVVGLQVHNNADDGVEFFGGTVNVRYLVLTGNDDDSIDTDTGWQGGIQFAIVTQRASGGDNIVEASSAGASTTPTSNARIANFTFVGARTNALRLNTGTIGRYVNGVISYGQPCFRWESTAGDGNAAFNAAVDPSFNSVLFSCTAVATSNSEAGAAEAAIAGGANNSTNVAATLSNTFVNGSAENAVTAFDVTTLGPFFTPVNYIGAVRNSSDRWWAGWSCGLEAATPC